MSTHANIVKSEPDNPITIDLTTHSILPSSGLRRAGLSGGGMGGTMLNPYTNREMGHDSDLERRWILQLLQEPDVAEIQEQHVRTTYVDRLGVPRQTIWDLLITRTDNTSDLVSVKRLEVAESPAYIADFKLMVEAIPPGAADRAWIGTEWNLVPALVDRGELYMRALKGAEPGNAEAALAHVSRLERPVTIGAVCDFLRQSGAQPVDPGRHFDVLSDSFWTVVWLLAKRKLVPVNDDYLTVRSEVLAS